MVDRYTKFMLTVIAAALVALVSQTTIQQARAQLDGPQKVQICDSLGVHCLALSEKTSTSTAPCSSSASSSTIVSCIAKTTTVTTYALPVESKDTH